MGLMSSAPWEVALGYSYHLACALAVRDALGICDPFGIPAVVARPGLGHRPRGAGRRLNVLPAGLPSTPGVTSAVGTDRYVRAGRAVMCACGGEPRKSVG